MRRAPRRGIVAETMQRKRRTGVEAGTVAGTVGGAMMTMKEEKMMEGRMIAEVMVEATEGMMTRMSGEKKIGRKTIGERMIEGVMTKMRGEKKIGRRMIGERMTEGMKGGEMIERMKRRADRKRRSVVKNVNVRMAKGENRTEASARRK